jgi:hypothetical protein
MQRGKTRTLGVMSDRADATSAIRGTLVLAAVACDVALLVWGLLTLLQPGGPRGEELVVVYWWVVPLIMLTPAQLALTSWLNRWELSSIQLFSYNAPFALAVAIWAWVASLPT